MSLELGPQAPLIGAALSLGPPKRTVNSSALGARLATPHVGAKWPPHGFGLKKILVQGDDNL